MYLIILSSRFQKSALEITSKNTKLKTKLKKFITLLRINPNHPSLRLHKLKNRPHWSFSVDIDYRVIASIEKNKIILTNIGPHDEVY